MTSETSEFADDRPVCCCAFSSDGSYIVTAGWTGCLKIWSVPKYANIISYKAHNERITGLATNPVIDMANGSGPAIATGSADRTARIWTCKGKLIDTLSGHGDRLGRVAFHPSGRLLA